MGWIKSSSMFALPAPPADRLTVAGVSYGLTRVFKHDFWAATCLYTATESGAEFPEIVVKFGRGQWFCGLPLRWLGRWLAGHEEAIYAALDGVAGVPRWVARVDDICYAIEYIDAKPLDHLETIPAGLFDRLGDVFDAIHARQVAYVDGNKKSNILVADDGSVTVIDFQISIRRRFGLGWLVRYFQGKDLYHLYKHKRRLAPDDLTEEEAEASRNRGGLHWFHRKWTKPYRAWRRNWLAKRSASGNLTSPTADLEDHHQPEKATWRKEE